ncbi:hypothetical protein [Halobacterium wangiae]|uniref:hypothetical protein n=1 Tax=Halobacterium wangiae TaxID=2902623 RepID=UPI001E346FB3|nr:hypothetical protein [Halobacterium wangiae]
MNAWKLVAVVLLAVGVGQLLAAAVSRSVTAAVTAAVTGLLFVAIGLLALYRVDTGAS